MMVTCGAALTCSHQAIEVQHKSSCMRSQVPPPSVCHLPRPAAWWQMPKSNALLEGWLQTKLGQGACQENHHEKQLKLHEVHVIYPLLKLSSFGEASLTRLLFCHRGRSLARQTGTRTLTFFVTSPVAMQTTVKARMFPAFFL